MRPPYVIALICLWSTAAQAQRAVRVRADNDAFNFWQAPWNRPDEEYTSGVRATLELDGGAAWMRPWRSPWRSPRQACASPHDVCASHSFTVGQDIYTALRTRTHPVPNAGARPDAGILWIEAADRVTRAQRSSELRWTLGITGRPALAAPMQRFFHGFAPGWNRPTDWSRQLPTEPVFAVAYDERRVRRLGAFDLQPHAGASLGSLLTEARAGLGAQWGRLGDARANVALVADVTVRGVVRNESLSGTLFRGSDRVALRPLVGEAEGGVRTRWRRLGLSWKAHVTGAEYAMRRGTHAWSTLEAEWWPSR